MNYNKNLIEDIIVCPNCGASLKKKENTYWCFGCKAKFPIVKDIPILLPSDLDKSFDFVFKKAQINFFDQWSGRKEKKKSTLTSFERYFSAEVGNKKIKYSEEEIKEVLKNLPGNSWVLELGCGAGEHSEFIARQRDDINLVMIDISLESILETQRRLKTSKLKGKYFYVVADAEKLPFRKRFFSTTIAIMFFHHLFSVQESMLEIKKTLAPKGICLIVDLLSDNPLQMLLRKIFPHLPMSIKGKFIADYVLENGEMPDVKIHQIKEIRSAINSSGLKIVKEEPHDLFLFIFGAIGVGFPIFKLLLSEKVLNFFYNVEKRMLRDTFFSNFASARILWLSY